MNIYTTVALNRILNYISANRGFKKDFKFHFLYIIYHIRTYPFKHREFGEGDFVPVNLECLRQLISYDYAPRFLKILVEEGILECDNHYIIGEKSKGYRIAPKFKKDKFFIQEITDLELVKKITERLNFEKDEILKRGDAYSYVTECMEHLEIDYDKANDYVKNLPKNLQKKSQVMLDIFDTKFATIDNTSNRLHNNLTNISSKLRSSISYDGKKLVQCDLKNSQPLLFRFHLNKYPYIPKKELDKYLNVVCNVGFYEFFAKKLGVKLTENNRVEFKKRIFGGVLFDRNRKNLSKYEKIFEKEFPIIFYCMRDMKKENYKDIPIALQKLESTYIFKCVEKIKTENKGIELLTIHDSIVTVEDKEDIVYKVMMEEFYNMFKIIPKIKIEKFV